MRPFPHFRAFRAEANLQEAKERSPTMKRLIVFVIIALCVVSNSGLARQMIRFEKLEKPCDNFCNPVYAAETKTP